MNLNTKLVFTTLVIVSIFSVGLISFSKIQPTGATIADLPGLDQIPGLDKLKDLIGDHIIINPPSNTKDDYLEIDKAVVAKTANTVQAYLQTHGHIPKDGSGGAFGYGILTSEGLDVIMVSTTHAGVLDSEDQRNANDPRWHNHYVSLGEDSDNCGNNPAVTSITFQSPGKVNVIKNNAVLSHLPSTFTGTNALNGDPLTLSPGTNVQNVVSFVLEPKFNDTDELQAVCVTNIEPADKVIKN